ncbi:hypothetical protein [Bacillus glycinifermentans]|uniref:Uncharacterized protein n=1 Tax=Bacillus glycinifermentans TaxID=1664069 RepID=A0A0T6BUC7_9BACI|nr:hypothetical protein [Bacillus glycinifermentans]ATH92502.1 hypothetical protein COP00_07580 [Bacillus glycinifermentans]KRT95248.1 hypothetical protein AB447_212125 [Bacillus glycinifermentans]MEC0485049.1 hypothetical protein [Bacillus glycinifermentans]MEC0497424.1 hypothetical protein [Bacillus glycinifermentans]MEC0539280.1 hypothetical protein [Bacillus glycinifermentans]
MVFVLILAGHETTVNLFGNGVLALPEHPEQKEMLKTHLELIHSTVEEKLRYNGPVHLINVRWASGDVELEINAFKKAKWCLFR